MASYKQLMTGYKSTLNQSNISRTFRQDKFAEYITSNTAIVLDKAILNISGGGGSQDKKLRYEILTNKVYYYSGSYFQDPKKEDMCKELKELGWESLEEYIDGKPIEFISEDEQKLLEEEKATKWETIKRTYTFNELDELFDSKESTTVDRFLKNVIGTYLISFTDSGAKYVGAAFGVNGFYGRWKEHFKQGGGGIYLKKHVKRNGWSDATFTIETIVDSETRAYTNESLQKKHHNSYNKNAYLTSPLQLNAN